MRSPEPTALAECDVFFFEAGGQVFGADPLDVSRVDRQRDELPLARLRVGGQGAGRVLVVRSAGGEVQVPVERVLGVRRLAQAALCKLPQYVAQVGGQAAAEILGLLVEAERPPVLVMDLKAISARAERPAR